MRKLVYWVAAMKFDSACYSLRAKTRKEVKKMLEDRSDADDYDKPKKVTIEYKDAFDLVCKMLDESGGESAFVGINKHDEEMAERNSE